MTWLLKALIKAILEVIQDLQYERDRKEAEQENARRDAEARDRAAQDATRGRIRDAEKVDPGVDAARERMRQLAREGSAATPAAKRKGDL